MDNKNEIITLGNVYHDMEQGIAIEDFVDLLESVM